MAFKPYCYECQTWHTEEEGHQHNAHVLLEQAEYRKWRRAYRQLQGLSDEEFDRRYGDLNA